MTKQMQFQKVTIELGFWEDADGFGLTEEQWRTWLFEAVKSWHHRVGPHMSVRTDTHIQTVMDDAEIEEMIKNA